MQRRDFLMATLTASAATFAEGSGSPTPTNEPAAGHRPSGVAVGQAGDRASDGAAWTVPAFEHAEATIGDLQRAQTEGRLTARGLTEAYVARMDAVDVAGPRLGSVIERNPDAIAIAEALDRERRKKGARGPLHGIPVLIKDNIDTADRMRSSAGSLALAESIAPRDAFLVELLKAAGTLPEDVGAC